MKTRGIEHFKCTIDLLHRGQREFLGLRVGNKSVWVPNQGEGSVRSPNLLFSCPSREAQYLKSGGNSHVRWPAITSDAIPRGETSSNHAPSTMGIHCHLINTEQHRNVLLGGSIGIENHRLRGSSDTAQGPSSDLCGLSSDWVVPAAGIPVGPSGRRASHVELDRDGFWWGDLEHVLPPFKNWTEALQAEKGWLVTRR